MLAGWLSALFAGVPYNREKQDMICFSVQLISFFWGGVIKFENLISQFFYVFAKI